MSIANEVERIVSAKNELKTELALRGADIKNDTLDTFASKLKELMHCIKGEWTPEEDTATFGTSGLNFYPEIVVVFNRDMHSLDITEAVSLAVLIRGSTGIVRYRKSDGQISHANVAPTSSVALWSDSGYEVTMPGSSAKFISGYTYEYYVLGRSL